MLLLHQNSTFNYELWVLNFKNTIHYSKNCWKCILLYVQLCIKKCTSHLVMAGNVPVVPLWSLKGKYFSYHFLFLLYQFQITFDILFFYSVFCYSLMHVLNNIRGRTPTQLWRDTVWTISVCSRLNSVLLEVFPCYFFSSFVPLIPLLALSSVFYSFLL